MHTIIQHAVVFIWPTVVWIAVTATGFGPQSLSNLIELPIVWLVSLLLVVIPNTWLSTRNKMLLAAGFVLLLRAFMPLIPE